MAAVIVVMITWEEPVWVIIDSLAHLVINYFDQMMTH